MNLNFLSYWRIYATISGLLILVGLVGLVNFGLKPSIDFTGGALLELRIDSPEKLTSQDIQDQINDIVTINTIQPTTDSFIIRAQTFDNTQNQQVQSTLESEFGLVEEIRFETVGPTLGRELLIKTFVAVVLGSLAISLYVAFQFKELSYGICAIIAMVHDTLIVSGIFAWLGYLYGVEVDTLFVTALLITLAFSIHDTIVVYDRIRESIYRLGITNYVQVVNKSVAETLPRSINNSMTTIFMLTALFLLGGESIRWFVFALLMGTIVGTYSSPFVAAPLLALWHHWLKRSA